MTTLTPDEMDELRFLLLLAQMKKNAERLRAPANRE